MHQTHSPYYYNPCCYSFISIPWGTFQKLCLNYSVQIFVLCLIVLCIRLFSTSSTICRFVFFSLQVYISKRYSILSVSISTVSYLIWYFFQPFFHHVLGWVTIHNNIPFLNFTAVFIWAIK